MNVMLSKWDEDTRYISVARARLRASNEVFRRYREEQCAFAAALGGGAIGNGLDMLRLACFYELDLTRAKQLESDATTLPVR